MNQTPAKARTTRCCGPEGCGGNSAGGRERYCIASACMAWRWSEAKRTTAFLADVHAYAKATGADFNKSVKAVYEAKGDSYEHTEGFCGLAGPR